MINKVLNLTKVFLKNSYNFNYNNKKENISKSRKTLMAFGILALILYMGAAFGAASYGIIKMLIEVNQEAMFLGIYFITIVFLVIFQSVFTSINLFYFSKDISYVLPLPLRPIEILMAKFNVLIIGEYATELVFALAPLLMYGILTGAGPLFYVFGVLVLLLIPILPALISCFLVMIIMSFSKITKYKDRFQVIVGVSAILLAVGFQMVVTQNAEVTNEQMVEMLMNQNGLVEMFNKYFVTLKFATGTLLNPNNINAILNIGVIIGITFGAYFIFMLFGQKLYLKGAVGNAESAVGKGKKINVDKAYKAKSVAWDYVMKEIKILFRNPIYFMQCILPAILIPIMLIVMYSVNDEQINAVKEGLISAPVYSTIFVCIVLGIIQFACVVSFVSITAISRDGQAAVFTKYVPVSFYKQFIYKMLPGVFINIIPTLISLVMVKVVIPHVAISYLITIFLISIIFNLLENYLMLIVDLKRPKLVWSSEYAVVKQNMNMIFEFMYTVAIIGILVLIGYFLQNVNYNVILLSITFVFAILTVLIDLYVKKNDAKLFDKIN